MGGLSGCHCAFPSSSSLAITPHSAHGLSPPPDVCGTADPVQLEEGKHADCEGSYLENHEYRLGSIFTAAYI